MFPPLFLYRFTLTGFWGFSWLVLSAGAEQRKDKTKKEPHDGELVVPYR